MKLEQLRKVIREEVKTAMREELQEILNEAVRVASKPTGKKITYNQTKESMTSQEYRNVYTGTSDMVSKPNFASSMANSMGIGNNQPGIDITKLNFVKKAGEVYNKAIEKDKQKYGVV